mmetsp:Transcript_866/g.1182  ORF Transcript_866/g.1182 Transcript_866/m.1182 type:complete len:330 (-) Transcript_866:384-1373(-)
MLRHSLYSSLLKARLNTPYGLSNVNLLQQVGESFLQHEKNIENRKCNLTYFQNPFLNRSYLFHHKFSTNPLPQKTSKEYDLVFNVPNALSMLRLISGPIISYWLIEEKYMTAVTALVISGATDWLDGYAARRLNQGSVLGSYLDPLADKVLILCVAGALLYNGVLPLWLGGTFVLRDVVLLVWSYIHRIRDFGYTWPGFDAFVHTSDQADRDRRLPSHTSCTKVKGGHDVTMSDITTSAFTPDQPRLETKGLEAMQPLFVSKVNTVLQLLLLGGYLTGKICDWPPQELITGLEYSSATTTVVSMVGYIMKYQNGTLFKGIVKASQPPAS